jgi:hypothetical protein
MNKILQLLLMLFVASLSFYIIGAVASFFGISAQNYIFYFIFALALGFLYFVLPQERPNIFQ